MTERFHVHDRRRRSRTWPALVSAVRHLAGPESSYTTGQTLPWRADWKSAAAAGQAERSRPKRFSNESAR